MNIIIQILPLLLDYISDPFQFVQTCKNINAHIKKYQITLFDSTKRKIDNRIFRIYSFKKLSLINNESLDDDDLKYLKDCEKRVIHTLNLNCNCKITDSGLQYLTGIHTLNLALNKNITDDGLQHLKNIQYLNLFWNTKITRKGINNIKSVDKSIINFINHEGF